ncbi:hypothetical protein [Psychroserpens sp. Hel_I_66]|uniref:hypothetical protein n=1 Tax=Psychroserpens sp. Hel_I_66 TaxID=1250004 RepID=UPI0012E05D3D|nr:hypothetical protein [Psychroserpens sp. Hel_I_66]
MKNILKLCIVCLLFASCETTESPLFDGTTGIGFENDVVPIEIPEGGITETLNVLSTTISSESRTFEAVIVEAVDDGDDTSLPLPVANISVGNVVIPANSYEGTVDVTFTPNGLMDFQKYDVQVQLVVPGGGSAFPPVTFDILKAFDITTFACSDLTVQIVADNFASETSFEITDADGVVVVSGGPYDDGTAGTEYNTNVTLAAGCYTFTIFDSYGDGLFDGNNEGTYDLFCAAQTVVSYASGSGDFGDFESTDFCIVE